MPKQIIKPITFLDMFPNHAYRYIDQTGNDRARPPISTAVERGDLNQQGYEAYFSVNGFSDALKATIDNLTNLNAFFIDIDGRKDPAELEAIKAKLEPTFIIETMRGYHIYWVLDEYVFKEELEPTQWAAALSRWQTIEEGIVKSLKGDMGAKDLARIMRIPNTLYWKKSGDAYKEGPTKALFKIKGIHKNLAARYSMDTIAESLIDTSSSTVESTPSTIQHHTTPSLKQSEIQDFFAKVNKLYPLTSRPSYQAIITAHPDSLPEDYGRNQALIVAASLMRQAEVPVAEAIDTLTKTGWHGMVAERGGVQEIVTTIQSAYKGGYFYSKKHPVIAHNMTHEEDTQLTAAYAEVFKKRREVDRVRFDQYEKVLQQKFPHIRKNEADLIYVYENGVYKVVNKTYLQGLIMNSMDEDMLWGYRTTKHANDKIACWLPYIPLFVENMQENVLNVQNGLLNITTRELHPHTPAYMSLYQSPVAYDPLATCPTWERSILAWVSGDNAEEKKNLLQQYTGYCLSASMKYAKMLILVGDGGNGKSTFADTISMMIGPKGTGHISLETLEKNFGLVELMGKRLNIVEEISGNFYHSHILKKIISGEEVTTDKKHVDHFTFMPTAKFIFAVNEMPRVDDSSQATERRMLVVMFNNNFRDNANSDLRFKGGLLAQELPGILNWALDGADTLRTAGGFVQTIEHTQALKEYREENSSADGFISDCIEFQEGAIVDTGELYEKYKIYCMKNGLRWWSSIRLTKFLKAQAVRTKKFSFIPRPNNHEPNKFEGFKINEMWDNYYLDESGHVQQNILRQQGF